MTETNRESRGDGGCMGCVLLVIVIALIVSGAGLQLINWITSK